MVTPRSKEEMRSPISESELGKGLRSPLVRVVTLNLAPEPSDETQCSRGL